MKAKNKLLADERGIVSIVVTVFFMLVLSLIVLSFSQTSKREQRQALDQQLSSQAFYAAESGINDTIKYIRDNLATLPEEKRTCDNTGFAGFPTGNVGEAGNIAYSCILFDKAPNTIEIGNLDTEKGEFRSIDTTRPLQTLKLSWRDTDGGETFSGCGTAAAKGTFPTQANFQNCDAGIVRVTIMTAKEGSSTRDGLSAATFTVFFRPVSDLASEPAPVTYVPRGLLGEDSSAQAQGQIIPAYCNSGACKASIDVSPSLGAGSAGSIYALFRSIYKDNTVTVSGETVGPPSDREARFTRAQIMIDSTGRASDVVRRLQVRVPLYEQYQLPSGFVVDSSGGVCKRLAVYPGFASDTDCGTGYTGTNGVPVD